MTFQDCYTHAESIFRMDLKSIHGPKHWHRVEKNAIRMAARTDGADLTVCRLFAIYHDSCRINDGSDHEHGPRAAAMLKEYFKNISTMFSFDATRLELLIHAVEHHTTGGISDNPTIGACWDADRLDLGRVGITPSSHLMSTAFGKELAIKN
jgi:uncharacterized protein